MTITTRHAPHGRGCGTRSAGSCYLCTGFGWGGQEVEYFVIDPVRRWPQELVRKDWNRGFQLLPKSDGTNDVIIFVGESFYASPWTFVEEVRHFGASRKVGGTFPFDKITPGKSYMLFVHPKAYCDSDKMGFCLDQESTIPLPYCNFFPDDRSLWEAQEGFASGWHPTVEKNKDGSFPHTACTFAHCDLACIFHDENDIVYTKDDGEHLEFQINAPSFNYTGRAPILPNIFKLEETYDKKAFQPGIFLRLPITHFEAKDYAGSWAEKAQKAGYAVEILDY